MPRIPIVEPSVGLNAASPMQVDQSLYSNSGKPMSDLATSLQSISADFQKMRDESELAKADTDLTVGLDAIKVTANKDQNPDNESVYHEAINKIIEQSLSGITNQQAQNLAAQKYRAQGDRAFSSVLLNKRGKLIERSKFEIIGAVDVSHGEHMSEHDGKRRALIRSEESERITRAFQKGIITADQAQAVIEDINVKWERDYIISLKRGIIMNDPEESVVQLLLGDEGAFKDVAEDDRQELLVYARDVLSKTRDEVAMAVGEREAAYIEQYVNFDPNKAYPEILDNDTLTRDVETGVVRPAFAKALRAGTAAGPVKESETTMMEDMSVRRMFMVMPKISLSDSDTLIQTIMGNPNLTRKDKQNLIDSVVLASNRKTLLELSADNVRAGMEEKAKRKAELSARKSAYRNAQSNIDWALALFLRSSYHASKALTNHMIKNPDDDPLEVANREIAKQRLLENPAIASYPKDGLVTVDYSTGIYYREYPDGTWEVLYDLKSLKNSGDK